MPPERLMQRVLWATTAVLVVAGVLSAAIVGAGGDGGDRVVTSSSPSTTAQAGGAGSPPGDAGGVTTTPAAPQGGGSASPGDSSGTPAAPGGSSGTSPQTQPPSSSEPQQAQGGFRDAGAVDDAGATRVPAAGTYSYRLTDGSGQAHEASTLVEDKGAAGGARRLTLTYRGENVDLVHDSLWGPEQVRYAKTTFMYGGSNFECDWQPDYVVMPLSLRRGAVWDAKSSCTVQAGATTAVLNRTTTAKVVDARRVQVAGGEVLTWVIESNDRLEFPGQGTLDTKETSWFAPALGLAVRQVVETSGSDGEDGGKSELVIRRLTPA